MAALTDIGKTLFNAISPCLEGNVNPADANPNNPGIQLQCTVSEVLNAGTMSETSTQMPACPIQDASTPAANGPRARAGRVDKNTTSCPAPDTGFEVNFVRTGARAPGTTDDVECAVAGT